MRSACTDCRRQDVRSPNDFTRGTARFALGSTPRRAILSTPRRSRHGAGGTPDSGTSGTTTGSEPTRREFLQLLVAGETPYKYNLTLEVTPHNAGACRALIAEHPEPNDGDIDEAMKNNVCRCGTYVRIRAAIKQAAR